MTGVLKEEFSRAFLNKRFGIVILLACISFAYGLSAVGQIQMDDQALGAVSLWLIILKQGYYGFFAALMAALPFADSLIIDRRHHFVDQVSGTDDVDYLESHLLAGGRRADLLVLDLHGADILLQIRDPAHDADGLSNVQITFQLQHRNPKPAEVMGHISDKQLHGIFSCFLPGQPQARTIHQPAASFLQNIL